MRIERNGVGQFYAIELLSLRHCRKSAIGAVDVEPYAVTTCNLRNLAQGIDRASIDSTGGSDDCHRSLARLFVVQNSCFEFFGNHPEVRVSRDQPQIVAPNSEQRHALWNRHVNLVRGINHHARSRALCVGRRLRFAGHGETHQVGAGSAAGKTATKTRAPHSARQPRDHNVLDGDGARAGAPRRHILVQGAGQKISNRGDGLA